MPNKTSQWIDAHKPALIIVSALFITVLIIHYLGWWEALGLLFLKFGLGAKTAGAKTFSHAIVKAGGKKAIAIATAGMLAKRHIIDLFSRFFAENSINKYKKNLRSVLKKQLHKIQNSPPMQQLKAFGSMLLSIPIVYFFWTKVLGTAIQKISYSLIVPLVSMLWKLITSSLNVISFIFKVIMLNALLDALAHYRWGRALLYVITQTISLLAMLLNFLNNLLHYIGLNPKRWLIRHSIRFNRWLESILDRGLSHITKIQRQRDRYINITEFIALKRGYYAQKKRDAKVSFWRESKKLFVQKVLKRKSWKEVRQERLIAQQQRLAKTVASRRKKALFTCKKKLLTCKDLKSAV